MGRTSYWLVTLFVLTALGQYYVAQPPPANATVAACVVGCTKMTNYSTNRQAEINSKASTTALTTHTGLTGTSVHGLGTMSTATETNYALLAGRAGGQTLIGGVVQTEILSLKGNAATSSGTNIAGGEVKYYATPGTGTGVSGHHFFTGTTLGTGTTLQTSSEKFTILGNGNVGIGTTSPYASLDVYKSFSGTTLGSGLDVYVVNNSANANIYGQRIVAETTAAVTGAATLNGLDITASRGTSVGAGPVIGLNVTANTGARGSGGTTRSYYGGKVVLNGSSAISSTASGLKYYGIYGEVANTTAVGESSIAYGVYGKASNVDVAYGLYGVATATNTSYGIYASGSGATTNYGVYSAAGTNYFSGNVGIGTTDPVSKTHIAAAPTASANYGTLSLGGGLFSGAANSYAGSASGTSFAINETTGYAGDLFGASVYGVKKFKVDYTGHITIPDQFESTLATGTAPLVVASETEVTHLRAATATALAANGSDCSAGNYAQGVDASGAATGCGVPAGTYSLPTATSSVLGGVKPDGTSILNTAGVLSATAASVGAIATGGNAGGLTGTPNITVGTVSATGLASFAQGYQHIIGSAFNSSYSSLTVGQRPTGDGYASIVMTSDDSTVGYISYASSTDKFMFNKKIEVTGTISASSGGSTNKAVCWKTGGVLGYCSTVVAADGSCTCN